jgi:hypothetical protein
MTWLVWRQHRNQAYIAIAALAGLAVVLVGTGWQMASQYRLARTSCMATHTCAALNVLTLGISPLLLLLVLLTMVVPCLMGVFWGGPLIARELETGTSQFTWTQSITRGRWLTAKVGWTLLAAAVWGGAIAALVTWWANPVNAVTGGRFQPGQFDVEGIVPVGYALFAVALGLAAGAVLRRTLPALAVTVVAFTAVRVAIAENLRPHYLSAVTATYNFLHSAPTPPWSYWLISQGLVGPGGKIPSQSQGGGSGFGIHINANVQVNGVPIGNLPSACRALAFQGPQRFMPCLAAHGYRGFITYQPASRYWAFQGIETGIFVLLAAVLVAVAAIAVLRRDA